MVKAGLFAALYFLPVSWIFCFLNAFPLFLHETDEACLNPVGEASRLTRIAPVKSKCRATHVDMESRQLIQTSERKVAKVTAA